jgi:hypothetical protein
MNCGNAHGYNQMRQAVAGRLHPNLLKALVMIAQKQTRVILDTRKKTSLIHLGRVHIHRSTQKNIPQWLDVLVSEDRTPLLRRVTVSREALDFHAISWTGWASIRCANTDCWDKEKEVWSWGSAESNASTNLLHDSVLPHIPFHMEKNDSVVVPDWPRHLELSSSNSLLCAVDHLGEGPLHEIEKARVLALLDRANADMNPLWSYYLRDGEWE